jgi:hypothetical protein
MSLTNGFQNDHRGSTPGLRPSIPQVNASGFSPPCLTTPNGQTQQLVSNLSPSTLQPDGAPSCRPPYMNQAISSQWRLSPCHAPFAAEDLDHFNIFQALLRHPELVFEMARHLPIDDLVSIYAISKDFHMLVDSRFMTTCISQALTYAPESAKIFRFKCYRNLCQHDPARRPNVEVESQVRDVPSFRWLRMLLWRDAIVDDIVVSLAAEGHRLPRKASAAIKKLWFMMDISDNARRIGLLHNKSFWSDQDIFFATMFMIKLDMRFTDPVDGNGETGIREMLLAQRTMTVLARVLRRERMHTQFEALRMFVEWKWEPRPEHRGQDIMGVPAQGVGRLQYEGWGSGSKKFVPLDELIMLEGVKRNLGLERRYLDMVLFGHIDHKTEKDVWPLEIREQVIDDLDQEWENVDSGDDEEDAMDYSIYRLEV